ncbi:MAG: hypothetical protein ACR2HN_11185 [Tepidiformaceae bacterium]
MNGDRTDKLLSEALATGRIPADADAAERVEVERLLAAVPALRASRLAAADEAQRSLPIARARFERHMAAAAARAAAGGRHRDPRPGMLGRLLGAGPLRAAGALAAVAMVVVAVVVASRSFNGVETANAQVLTPGDYVQVQGVVSSAAGDGDERTIELRSQFGSLAIDVSTATIAQDGTPVASLAAGDSVVVGGTVGKDRKVNARTLARTAQAVAPPLKVKFHELRRDVPELAGKVVTLTLAKDGSHGQVLVDAGDGQRFIVRVDAESAGALLERFGAALGVRVLVVRVPGAPAGVYSVTVPEGASRPPERPEFAPLKGVIAGREGALLQVRTGRGVVPVLIRPETRIVLGQSGLTLDGVRRGETASGHTVSVSGGRDHASGVIVADVIVVGPKPVQQETGGSGDAAAGAATPGAPVRPPR